MLRDVFYYGSKPNVHPREQFAENLADARLKATTRDFWIINEFCDYRNFDWDFDFEFLPDEDVWAEDHNNVWPSQHQKDSGTWLCPKEHSDLIIYRGDVDPVIRKNEKNDNWVELDAINHIKFDFSWHPDPTDPPYIYKWPCKFFPAEFKHVLEYRVPGATQEKYMNTIAELVPEYDRWVEHQAIDKDRFDLSWRPNPLDPPFIYVWGNKYIDGTLKPTLAYHAPGATDKKYMSELVSVLPETDRWKIIEDIDTSSFDFTWRPDPREPAFIYVFGNEQHEGTIMPTVEYHCPDATEVKYVDDIKAKLASKKELFEHLEDSYGIDYSWRPDPTSPPYIYAWGNQWNAPEDKVSIQFVVPGATEYKYMSERAIRKSNTDNWFVPNDVDTTGFDFSWEPSPAAPPYIYEFATQWQKTGGPQYVVPSATEKQYVDFQKVTKLPSKEQWTIPENIDTTGFDFSWHPDDTSPPYVYIFATQWAFSGGPAYTVEGATETKYVDDQIATATKDMTNWVYDDTIDIDSFDFSWHPYVEDQPYIYQFGTQWQKTGGPKYITPGADSSSPVKYIDTRIIKSTRLPDKHNSCWVERYPVKDFDYSWHPDDTDEPYIYVFGNKYYSAEEMPTVEYRVPGATQVKYINDIIATLVPSQEGWEIPDNVDVTGFDFSWRPSPLEEPYVYQFGTQWQKTGGPRYVVGKATQVKYVDSIKAVKLPDMTNWDVPSGINIVGFDFSWHPDDTATPFIYQFGTQWALTGGPRYVVPGATEISYVEDMTVIVQPSMENWEVPDDIVIESFDFSWHPYAADEPFIYQFGTQWQKTGGPRYVVPGATNVKYIDTRILKATKLPNRSSHWEIPDDVDISEFDFSWHPDDTEHPFIYQFGTQWQKTNGPRYVVDGATEINYISNPKARSLPNRSNWTVPDNIDDTKFDFSWHPDDTNPPYNYIFATQWSFSGGPVYTMPGATEVKYIEDQIAIALPDRTNWVYDETEIDVESFDFSWHPYVEDQPYVYQFGTQWQKTGGPRYVTPDADENSPIKYIDTRILKATRLPNKSRFKTLGGAKIKSFDWSWHPDDTSPPFIYIFGNQWYNAEKMPTIEYTVTGATEVKFLNDPVATLAPKLDNWKLPNNIDTSRFDFSWFPDPTIVGKAYIYQFGTKGDPSEGPAYLTPGHENEVVYLPKSHLEILEPIATDAETQIELIEEITEEVKEVSNEEQIDMFFVDRSNPESAARFEALRAKYGTRIQKTRYLNSWVDTINRCTNRATSELIWILNSELDYSSFDFSYYPNMWQMKMVHVFGTQWSHWGTTFMVNRETFGQDTKYIKIIEHLNNLNFVKDIRANATKCSHDIVVIDHGNTETTDVVSTLQQKAPDRTVTTAKYNNSYLDTLKDIIKRMPEKKEHFIWVCSSVCDYTDFDFTYIIDPFSRDNLHVFPSGKQKFGDTFFIDVNNARAVIGELEQLENFAKVNYNGAVKANRLPEPIIVISDDTHTNSIDKITDFPYATLITSDNVDIGKVDIEPMNLWSVETKNIYVTSTGATRIVVPKEIKNHVTKELYEYPYIKRAPKLALSKPLDIVYLSNGETGADENYEHLLNITKNLPNRVVRVDGVNGRAAAYHAAAEASETPWMFTVFAKLKVSPKFDWNWQPDRMQSPKHYIFHAKNPVNGLIYGHQAMIAYNKKLTLANDGKGLDFTLDDEHEVVPLISGTAQYNTDEFSTWRTAFREVIKLRADDSDVSKERLDAWLNKAEGDFAQYSIKGALDADEYYDEVDGDFDKLKLSYEWIWLREKFDQI